MKTKFTGASRFLVYIFCASILSACAVAPAGPYYRVSESPSQPASYQDFTPGPKDQNYVMQVSDRTPFGLERLPKTDNMLYSKGYDRVRTDRDADFAIDVAFAAGVQDNPNVRAGNTLGGALAGAAAGAIIGGATGHPGTGAAIGAASGGALGMVAPAGTSLVTIEINLQSFRDRQVSHRTATVDLTNVPPYDVARVVDTEVARLLESLPRR